MWAHLGVSAGRIIGSPGFAFPWPKEISADPIQKGLFARDRPGPLLLGRAQFGAKKGVLVLAPSYPGGGMEGDHLIFYWSAHGIDYMISIHGWEPFTQVAATLRAIVLSTGG
jgi:hypothetical protein